MGVVVQGGTFVGETKPEAVGFQRHTCTGKVRYKGFDPFGAGGVTRGKFRPTKIWVPRPPVQ